MKKFFPFLLLIWLLILTGCFALPVEEEVLPPPVAGIPEARPMRTATVVRDDVINFTNVQASYLPARQETLWFAVPGQRIRGVFVTAGDYVQEGDILAELERPYIHIQLEDAKRDEEWALLDLTHHDMRQTMARRHAAQTGTSFDAASYNDARRRIEGRIYIVQQRIEFLQQEADALFLRAPFDGVVTWALDVSGVMWSYVGQEAVIVADQDVHIFLVTGDPAEAIHPGLTLDVTVDGEEFTAIAIDPENYEINHHPIAGRAEAFLKITDGIPPLITPRTSIMVHVILDAAHDRLAVPNLAVSQLEGRTFVYVLYNDVVSLRYVEIGLIGNSLTEIISGLYEGEVVVL